MKSVLFYLLALACLVCAFIIFVLTGTTKLHAHVGLPMFIMFIAASIFMAVEASESESAI